MTFSRPLSTLSTALSRTQTHSTEVSTTPSSAFKRWYSSNSRHSNALNSGFNRTPRIQPTAFNRSQPQRFVHSPAPSKHLHSDLAALKSRQTHSTPRSLNHIQPNAFNALPTATADHTVSTNSQSRNFSFANCILISFRFYVSLRSWEASLVENETRLFG